MSVNLLQAIARQEGFGVPNGRSTRNNNPGDIEFGVFAKAFPGTVIETIAAPKTPRFAHFPSVAVGFDAMKELFLHHYKGMTVAQALDKYAPPVENQTNSYITNVCNWCNCTPDTIIDTLLPE